jgi:predicted phage tail component-like protein
MLYEFKDTIEVSEGITLPSEAMQINGEYIENVIVGYRTLQVSGRESLAPELDLLETAQDGARLKNKRYPARTITIKYQLCCESPEAFRQAYNDLGRILNCTDAELIFADEQDKYFIGTPYNLGEVPPGKNNVVSTFEILCIDPFKYSCIEYEATPALEESSILIDYQGTHRAFPILQANMYDGREINADGETENELAERADCGYVAFFNESEKIIQLGDPEEIDGVTEQQPSQTLINNIFDASTSWGSKAQAQWLKSAGITFGMGVASYETVNKYGKQASYTSATLFNGNADSGEPMLNYKVVAKASKRTASSVRVNVSITAALTRETSYYGRGYGLQAFLYVDTPHGTEEHSVILKNTTSYWRGRTGHTANMAFTISGLSATATTLSGIRFKVKHTKTSTEGTAGILSEKACKNLPLTAYATQVPDKYFLRPDYGGQGDTGAFLMRSIPADKNNEAGATNFTFTFCNKFSIGSGSAAGSQIGSFTVGLLDANMASICRIRIDKNTSGKTAKLEFTINNKIMFSADVDIAYNNALFAADKQQYIRKQGDLFTFNVGGFSKSFRNAELADKVVTDVLFLFSNTDANKELEYNGLHWVKFVKDYCDVWRDIPNKFSAGDIVEADCRSGEIFLNGKAAPELGAIGNNWESFYLTPGLNQIGIAYSDWLSGEYIPACKVRYREVFL